MFVSGSWSRNKFGMGYVGSMFQLSNLFKENRHKIFKLFSEFCLYTLEKIPAHGPARSMVPVIMGFLTLYEVTSFAIGRAGKLLCTVRRSMLFHVTFQYSLKRKCVGM